MRGIRWVGLGKTLRLFALLGTQAVAHAAASPLPEAPLPGAP
jgi:hypothetical protein